MAIEIPFKYDFDYEYGKIKRLTPLIRRVVANNADSFTFRGTNTYIVGNEEVALIDPGPNLEQHVTTILEGLKGEVVTHILITHTHFDHWLACKPVKEGIGGRTYGYYPRGTGESDKLQQEKDLSFVPALEEKFNRADFVPDVSVEHGGIIEGNDWSLECVYTPGHAPNHISYQLREEKALFTGDHVMGWSTSVISPPSGNMEDYMASLELLLKRDDELYWPAHGPGIEDPKSYVRTFITHREEREQQILKALAGSIDTIQEMVPGMYYNVPETLHPAAERSVWAAILYMLKKGTVACDGEPSLNAKYRLP
jgi:glyoxylase-like metal-dependent hydrolase (beta-lactamase superfamily II)